MNDFHSRSGIHAQMHHLNAEAVYLTATVKASFEELEV